MAAAANILILLVPFLRPLPGLPATLNFKHTGSAQGLIPLDKTCEVVYVWMSFAEDVVQFSSHKAENHISSFTK